MIHFILVNPSDPRNIGASARAMNAMGFESLILVNPCDHLCGSARALAHNSSHILEQAQVFTTLSEAIQTMDLCIATTARHRKKKHRYHHIQEVRQIITDKKSAVKNVAIVFGGEQSGLSNSDLLACDVLTSIPIKNKNPSLNLSQAVMVYAYELSSLPLHTEDDRIRLESATEVSYLQLKIAVDRLFNLLPQGPEDDLPLRVKQGLTRLNHDDLRLVHRVRRLMQHNIEWVLKKGQAQDVGKL